MKALGLTLTLLLFLLHIGCNPNPEDCDCESSFDWMTETFMENDAGFMTLVENNHVDGINSHTKIIRRKAKRIRDIHECQELMLEWLHFFRKEHIGINTKIPFPEGPQNTPSYTINSSIQVKALGDKTLYLKIHSFRYQHKKQIDNLLKQNESLFTSFPILIIDIRGSSGGSNASFQGLIPFLYTNPIRLNGVEFYSSEQNAIRFEQLAEIMADKSFLKMAEKMRSTLGEFVMSHDSVMTASLDTVLPYPEKIGIICNRYNASADESFLLFAKQSQKVKIFGEPTLGALDYSNMTSVKSPDENFELWYAMSRRMERKGYPIDGIGIQPDFYLDRLLEEDWVEYTRGILEQ